MAWHHRAMQPHPPNPARPALRLLRRLCAAVALGLLAALPAGATCTGQNLIAQLPAPDAAALEAATAAQPFARGNLWRATRAGQDITLAGTYHLPDPRHAAMLNAVDPALRRARLLLVEAGPEQEAALKRDMAARPGLLFLTEGPSLMQRLSPADWQALAAAMEKRRVPAIMAAKMRPWYVAMALALPPCDLDGATTGKGLDHQILDRATALGLPHRALEPHDTLFRIFDQIPEADQIAMIRATLLLEDRIADYAVTTADAYFAAESRKLWEYTRITSGTLPGYTPATADAEYARLEAALMTARNRAWIPVLEQAAAQGPVVAAFGALHLSGTGGVLALLQARGWQITRLDG